MAKKPGRVEQFAQYLKGFSLLRGAAHPPKAAPAAEEAGARAPASKHGGWRTMPYIIGNETFERVASFGLTANLTVYLVKEYHMGQTSAVTLTQIWNGTTNFAPLLGAFLADAYWGRFRTIAWACVATFLGMVAMTLTAAVRGLRPPHCELLQRPEACESASRLHMSVLALALGLLALGAAGVRPCNLPFGMDQFDRGTHAGRRAVASYFNWYYATNTLAVVLAMTLLVYLQDSVSWALGFGVSAVLMLLALAVFFAGAGTYVYVPPEGSIFTDVARVLVAAFRKRSVRLPPAGSLHCAPPAAAAQPLPHTGDLRFLDKAAIPLEGDLDPATGKILRPWSLCSVQRVEEVKCLVRVIPVWISGITCMVAIAQQFTYAVIQSLMMDRHLGPHFEIPPASIAVISLLAIVLFLPIYDRLLVPALRRITGLRDGGITLLQRMGIGIAISAASMVVAGIVERRRRRHLQTLLLLPPSSQGAPMSALWLVPQLALVGISEAFNAVGQIEFYNQQFPEQMRSLATSLFWCSVAGANYLSSIVVTLVRKHTSSPNWLSDNINSGRLDYFYYLLAAMGGVDLLYFLIVAHFYRYKGVADPAPEEEPHQGSKEACNNKDGLENHHSLAVN